MKKEKILQNAMETLHNAETEGPAKTYDEVVGRVHAKMDAERNIELCAMFDSLEQQERDALANVPAHRSLYSEGGFKPLKEKLNVSWNELELIRRMTW